MKKNKIKIILSVFIFSLFVYNLVFADFKADDGAFGRLTKVGGKAEFKTENVDIRLYLGELIKNLLAFLGVVFLGLLIYGGFTWMRARGDSSAVDTAKDTMINSAIGLIIVLGAYLITYFVIQTLTASTLI